jgi:3-oxoacyl-[acyl-carrier protein] reductase
MIARRRGVIVTMASSAARTPARSNAAYAAAKAGVVMLSRHLANEVGRHGIRVNCVAPGAILTPGGALARAPEDIQQQVAESHPLGRWGTPEDVALATLFLASDSSSWLTGLTVDIAGGKVML